MGSLPANAGATQIAIDPQQPKRVYAVTTSSLYRSDDAGEIWQPAAQGLPDDGIAAVALDPHDPEHLYAATTDGALFVSEDGATNWRRAGDATPNAAT